MGRKIHYYPHQEPTLGDASGITARRAQVLELIARGLTTEDVAYKLGVSEDTVKAHLEHLRLQFAAANRVELIYQACANGVLGEQRRCEWPELSVILPVISKPTEIDRIEARSKSRLKTRRRGKFPAELTRDSTGADAFYDIPAYLRRQALKMDRDNEERRQAYIQRAMARIQGEAA